jgi:hypothetical protein
LVEGGHTFNISSPRAICRQPLIWTSNTFFLSTFELVALSLSVSIFQVANTKLGKWCLLKSLHRFFLLEITPVEV